MIRTISASPAALLTTLLAIVPTSATSLSLLLVFTVALILVMPFEGTVALSPITLAGPILLDSSKEL